MLWSPSLQLSLLLSLRIAVLCMILLHMGLQLQRLSFPHQLLFKNVVMNTSYAIYHFRLHNE